MRQIICILSLLSYSFSVAAQKDSFDIATFNVPKGWQKIDTNGIVGYQNYRSQNDQLVFCQIILHPSRNSQNTPQQNFNEEWNTYVQRLVTNATAPVTSSEKTPDGWTAISGLSNVTEQGINYTCMLVAVSGYGKVMTIVVKVAGQEYFADVEKFLNSFELDSKRTVSRPNNNVVPGNFTWSNYSFIAPERWYQSSTKDYILLSQSQEVQNGCALTILPPIASSGDLEADARNLFAQMYPGGWKYRQTGEQQYDISRGYTLQGLPYVMMEAPMHKMRPDGYYYDYEDGSILVIGAGKQIVVISGRHNRLIPCFCKHQYEYWRRFFNSFTIKDQPTIVNREDVSKRIVGDWMTMGGNALTEYIFAANGNYQFIGAYSTTSRVTTGYTDYLEIKTSGWKGDGSYTINGNQITFKKYGGKPEDPVAFRFEKVNHGGTGWKDRLYMLNRSVADGKLFEVCYEKRSK